MKNFENILLDYEYTILGQKFEEGKYLHVKSGSNGFIFKIQHSRSNNSENSLRIKLKKLPTMRYETTFARYLITMTSANAIEQLLNESEFQILDTIEENPYDVNLNEEVQDESPRDIDWYTSGNHIWRTIANSSYGNTDYYNQYSTITGNSNDGIVYYDYESRPITTASQINIRHDVVDNEEEEDAS